MISYDQIIRLPAEAAAAIIQFAGGALNTSTMAVAVDISQHRNRWCEVLQSFPLIPLIFYLSSGKLPIMQDRGMATRERILDAAQTMIQGNGYNGVSFRDLSAALELKSASIHYYFPSKEDLGEALITRYRVFFSAGCAALDQKRLSPARTLKQYIEVLRTAFRQSGHMCLCGVLAAEMSSLPDRLSKGVRDFFAENELWLARVLASGRTSGDFRFNGPAERTAEAVFASLEGALMSAWTFRDENRISAVGKLIIESLLKLE